MDWQRLVRPGFWIQNEPTSRDWDKLLNAALDSFPVEVVGHYTCRVGPFTVWVENWPYAYGKRDGRGPRGLPKVGTRLRLRRALSSIKAKSEAREIEDARAQLNSHKEQSS